MKPTTTYINGVLSCYDPVIRTADQYGQSLPIVFDLTSMRPTSDFSKLVINWTQAVEKRADRMIVSHNYRNYQTYTTRAEYTQSREDACRELCQWSLDRLEEVFYDHFSDHIGWTELLCQLNQSTTLPEWIQVIPEPLSRRLMIVHKAGVTYLTIDQFFDPKVRDQIALLCEDLINPLKWSDRKNGWKSGEMDPILSW